LDHFFCTKFGDFYACLLWRGGVEKKPEFATFAASILAALGTKSVKKCKFLILGLRAISAKVVFLVPKNRPGNRGDFWGVKTRILPIDQAAKMASERGRMKGHLFLTCIFDPPGA
jgi:hypothetical protein